MATKIKTRKKMRQRRQNLSKNMSNFLATQFTQHFLQTSLFKTSKRIGCYLPNDGELNLQFVIQHIWGMNKTCFLQVLNRKKLLFTQYHNDMQLKENRFGIPEPAISPRKAHSAHNLDLILIPLVAFDRAGNRLGMGGGFYDRTLAFLDKRAVWLKPKIYGVAYEFQQVDSIKTDAWDIPLHGVLTEIKQYDIR